MLAYHFLLSYPFFNLFRISPCTEKDRFWAPTQWHVTVRVLHSSITSLRSALHHGLSYLITHENVMLKFFSKEYFKWNSRTIFPLLIPDKNGLYLKIKLTTIKFKRMKRSYAGGLLIKKELSYFYFIFFSSLISRTITSVGPWKRNHFKGYYGLLELFIPVTQDIKFVFCH